MTTMPLSQSTLSELKNTAAQFDLLLTAPSAALESLTADARLCAICQYPFDNSVWKPGATINNPVTLACGHIFGLQCLAHLVFTTDFKNRCPLCRELVIPESVAMIPSAESWKAAAPLLRVVMMFGGDGKKFEKAKALDVLLNGIEKEGLTEQVKGKHMQRITLLYEEFLNRYCDEKQPLGDTERLRISEAREQHLQDLLDQELEFQHHADELRAGMERLRREEMARVKEALEEAKKGWEETQEKLENARQENRHAFLRKELRLTTAKLERTQKELRESRKTTTESVMPYALAFITLGGTIAAVWAHFEVDALAIVAVWAHFEVHALENSTISVALLASWLVYVSITIIRSGPTKKPWIWFGVVACCVLLGMGVFSERDRLFL